ncbi:hypothetical protein OD917_10905, partial [Flavobacterium sp. SH_e]|uniref:beta strand repeat-containing protein n=1 Tax=Flavobacterium sp. SH_e TaxID=2983767 RepID=UPI0021E3B394
MMRKLLYSFLFFILLHSTSFGQKIWTGTTNSNWNVGSNWSPAGVPTGTDAVQIPSGSPVVTLSSSCSSITFTGNTGDLSVDSGVTLTTGVITVNSSNSSNRDINILGSGTLSASSVVVGLTATTPSSNRTTTLTSTIANFNISGNLTLNSRRTNGGGGNNILNDAGFYFEEGTLDINGQITTVNQHSSNTSTFSMATGAQQSGLLLLGNASPFSSLSGTGTNTINLNGSSATVNYDLGGAQTVYTTPYNNLILSNSGVKTFAVTTVNNDLTVTGTASATTGANLAVSRNLAVNSGASFTIGSNYTLGVTGTTTVGGTLAFNGTGTKTFTGDVTINSGGTWNETGNSTMSFAGNLQNNGTYTATNTSAHNFTGASKSISGSSLITIPSVAVSGTYTNNNTSALTISTTLSGAGTLTNAPGSTLNIGGTSSIAVANLINTGTLNLNTTGTITGITNNAGGTVNLNSSGTITSFNNATATSQLNITALTVPTITTLTTTATGNTVNYNGAGNQTIKANTYSNLTTSGSGTKTLGGATTANANVTIGSGTTLDVSATNYALTVGGDFTNSGTFTPRAGTVTLNGTGQSFNVTNFYNLVFSGGGTKTFPTSAVAISGNLSIASGTLANLNTNTGHTAVTLTLNGTGQNNGSYGSTVSAATFKNGTYFGTSAAGILNVSTASCIAGYWTGATSTDWNTASNWCGNTIPTATTDVVIPSGTTYQPTIAASTTALTRNLTINSGATLTMANSTNALLNVSGNFTNSGTFTPGTAGTVTFNGTNQSTNVTSFYNLAISGSGTLTFTATTNVAGLWSVSKGAKAALGSYSHTAGILTLAGVGPLTSTWGSTSSNPTAANTNDTFFSTGNTGRITVSGTPPYPAIDNNYASYGSTGQVTGVKGEYEGLLTLSAPIGSIFINVKFASYGLPNGTAPNFTIGSCHAYNSRSVTTDLLGNTSATIPSSGSYNATFGDPCYGIEKKYYVVATYSTPICAGTNPGTITGSTPTGGNGSYSYLWEVSTTSALTGYTAAPGVNNGKDYTITGTVNQKTFYRRTVTSGIYSDETIVIVVTNTLAEISAPTSASTTASTICAGTPITLTVNGGNMGTNTGGYAEWTSGSCNGTLVGRSTLANGSFTVTPTANTTYYVKYKNACGETACGTPVVINNTTSVTVTPATLSSTMCQPSAITNVAIGYSGTTGNPVNYSIAWDAAAISAGFANKTNVVPSPGFTAAGGAGTISNAINVPANVAAGTYTASFSVSSASCTSFGTTITVVVNPNLP